MSVPPGISPAVPSDLAHLRPCTGLELLDRVFQVLRVRPSLLIGLGALGGLISLAAQLLETASADKRSALLSLVLVFLSKWPLGAVLLAAFQTQLLPRRRLAIRPALRVTFSRLPHLVLTYLLAHAILGMIGIFLPYQLLRNPTGGWLLDPKAAALAGVTAGMALYLAALWALAPAVVLLEGRMLFDALGRSTELMRLRFTSRLFGDSALRRLVLLLTVAVLAMLLAQFTGPGIYWIIRGMPLPTAAEIVLPGPSLLPESVQMIPLLLLACLFWPYIQTSLAVLYAECRMRHEALDLQTRLMARESHQLPEELPLPEAPDSHSEGRPS